MCELFPDGRCIVQAILEVIQREQERILDGRETDQRVAEADRRNT